MSRYTFDVTTTTSLLELELGDAHMPSCEEYWRAPLTRTVIGPSPIEEAPTKPSGVASRDSHSIGA